MTNEWRCDAATSTAIRGGTVVVGTGRGPQPANMPVENGRIVEIASRLPHPLNRTIDAYNALVTAGVIHARSAALMGTRAASHLIHRLADRRQMSPDSPLPRWNALFPIPGWRSSLTAFSCSAVTAMQRIPGKAHDARRKVVNLRTLDCMQCVLSNMFRVDLVH